MITIRHKRHACIGCAYCAEFAPNYWSIDEEGLAQLKDVLRHEEPFELSSGFEEDREVLTDVQKQCPVSVIRIDG